MLLQGFSITFSGSFLPALAEIFPNVLKNSPKTSAALTLPLTIL